MAIAAIIDHIFPSLSMSVSYSLHINEFNSISFDFTTFVEEKMGIVKELINKDNMVFKKRSTIRKANVAEFMIHLYINIAEFK